jgi:hypothetical protein
MEANKQYSLAYLKNKRFMMKEHTRIIFIFAAFMILLILPASAQNANESKSETAVKTQPAAGAPIDLIAPENLQTFSMGPKRFGGAMAEDGTWAIEASVKVQDLPDGTQELTTSGSLEMQSAGLAFHASQSIFKGVFILVIGERTFNANGDYSYGQNMLCSTYLTDTGLPVEGYSEGLPTDLFGGNTRHPINRMMLIPSAEIDINTTEGIIQADFEIKYVIDSAEVPAGYYRFCVLPGIQLDDTHFVTLKNEIPANEKTIGSAAVSVIGLAPIGKPAVPHIPWLILEDYITGGVVARHDQDNFAVTRRTTINPVAIIPLINPDGGQMRYNLEPSLPDCLMKNNTPLNLDFTTGEVAITIKTPDGNIINLGSSKITADSTGNLATENERFVFSFSSYGKHEIDVKGMIKDRNGLEIYCGGVYDVYVANPVEIRPVLKPGMPLKINETLDLALRVFPSIPAKITVEEVFNPWSNRGDVNKHSFDIKCNRYGIYIPVASTLRKRITGAEKIRFTEPGEYRINLIAEYQDRNGTLYMGSTALAGIVMDKGNIQLEGENPSARITYPYGDNVFTVSPSSDELFAFPLNAKLVFDPDLKVVLDPALLESGILRGEKSYDLTGGKIGVLPRSTAMNTPAHFYPEKIDRKMYSYIAAVSQDGRIFFLVKDGGPMTEKISDIAKTLDVSDGDFFQVYGSMVIRDSSLRKKDLYYGAISSGAVPSGDIENPQLVKITDGNVAICDKATPFFHSFTFYPGVIAEKDKDFIPRFYIFPPLEGVGLVTLTYPNGEKLFIKMSVDGRGFAWTNPDSPPKLWLEGVYRVAYTFFPGATDPNKILDTDVGICNVEFPFYVISNSPQNCLNWNTASGLEIDPNRELHLVSIMPQDAYVEGTAYMTASFNGEIIGESEIPFTGNGFEVSIPINQFTSQIKNYDPMDSHDVIEISCFVKGINAKGKLNYMAGRLTVRSLRIEY